MIMTYGSLKFAGDNGGYWVSTAYTPSLYSYDAVFHETGFFPSNSDERWYGFTVRASNGGVWPVKPNQRLSILDGKIIVLLK